jgi:hypothetical protein
MLKRSALSVVLLIELCLPCCVLAAEPIDDKQYPVTVNTLVEQAERVSNEIKSVKSRLESSGYTLESEKDYYVPRAGIANEHKQLYGKPVLTPNVTNEVILDVTSKLYGSEVDKKINAAEYGVSSNEYLLDQKKLELYYSVLVFLSKIERTRQYEYEASLLRTETVEYLNKLKRAVDSGIAPYSDLRQSELNLVRYDDAVYGAISAKEKYFDDLERATGLYVSDRDNTGVNYQSLRNLIEGRRFDFSETTVLSNNLELKAKSADVERARLAAESQNERLSLSFISQNVTSTLDGNPATAGDYRAWDSKNKSYVGLRVDYQLYDAQKSKQQSAAMAAYRDEKYALMDRQQKIRNDVLTLKNTLSSLLAKRENMLEQIRLNRELLETQKKEVIIDKVTFLEMSKNYLLFNQSYLSLLTLDTQIYDAIFEYGKLNAEKLL